MIKYYLLLLLLLTANLARAETGHCAGCHNAEVEQWQQSQHARAMQPATPDSVLGHFDGSVFTADTTSARFIHRDGQFLVQLEEAGQSALWQVRYTFGVYPLQQYLIDIGDGKLQALNIAWDSRPADQGGQRWFRLDQDNPHQPGHPLHWRGVYQNWNSMCADCHSSGFSKGYQPDSDRFASQYQQGNVSCNACHSDSAAHAAAAEQGRSLPAGADLAAQGAWLTGNLDTPPRHTGPASPEAQTETCGRCHALRTRLDQSPHGKINDQYSLNRLHAPLYFADGRVREEVFVLGSFLQSKMHQAGVTCSNCHNPHSAKPKLAGNALCSQCHAAASFDRSEHHQHETDSAGAQCVSCHMPTRTFMQIDARREHNFTTPNPHTAKLAGSPDPCLACHQQQDRDWSIAQMARLWPAQRERDDWFSIQQAPLSQMLAFIADDSQAPLYRASLLEQQAPALAANAPAAILQQLDASDPLLRESGWKAAAAFPASEVVSETGSEQVLQSLQSRAGSALNAPQLSVRLAAFETLMLLRVLPADTPATVRQEYEQYLEQAADRPAGRTLRARYRLQQNDATGAEADLRKALTMDREYLPAYLLLSDLLRQQQRLDDSVTLLSAGLVSLPHNAELQHLRGLTRLQQRRVPEALEDLRAACTAAPDNADFGYRYALALHLTGDNRQSHAVVMQLQTRFAQHPGLQQLAQRLARAAP